MRLPTSPAIKGNDPQFERMPGPTVRPGTYQMTLMVGKEIHSQSFHLIKEARSKATVDDLQRQFDLLMAIYQLYTDATETVNEMRRQRGQLTSLAERLAENDEWWRHCRSGDRDKGSHS